MPTNKRFLRKCREATEAGADGVVPQQNPARRRLGTTPPARPFVELDGLAGTPPNLGGEFKRSPANSFTPSGWSVLDNVTTSTFTIMTTPSAPLRRLRAFFLLAQPPLLFQEGNTLSWQFIHTFIDRRYSSVCVAG